MDAVTDQEPRALSVKLETPHGAGDMAYLDYGDPGRPVDAVFVHANGFNARAYRTILTPLAKTLRILTPDQRGHGATALDTTREGRTSWNDLKDDLLAFLDALGLGRVALAGHSMGGTASLLASAEAPDRVRALALFDPVILPPAAARQHDIAGSMTSPMVAGALKRRRSFPSHAAAIDAYRGRGAFRTWTEAMLADYVVAGFKPASDGTVELACAPEWEVSNYIHQAHDSWGAFERSVCPIRILRAETGSPGRIEEQIEELTATGRIKIDTVPGTTHFLPMERPDLVRETLGWAIAQP